MSVALLWFFPSPFLSVWDSNFLGWCCPDSLWVFHSQDALLESVSHVREAILLSIHRASKYLTEQTTQPRFKYVHTHKLTCFYGCDMKAAEGLLRDKKTGRRREDKGGRWRLLGKQRKNGEGTLNVARSIQMEWEWGGNMKLRKFRKRPKESHHFIFA